MTTRLLRPTRSTAAVASTVDEDRACCCGSMMTRRRFGDTQHDIAPGASGTRALADNPAPAGTRSYDRFNRPRQSCRRRNPGSFMAFVAVAVVCLMAIVVGRADAAYFGRLDTSNFFFDDTEVEGGDSEHGSPGSGSGNGNSHGRVTNSPAKSHGLVNDVIAPGVAFNDDEDGGSGHSPLSHPFWSSHGDAFGLPVDNSIHKAGEDADPDVHKKSSLPLADVDAENGDEEEGSGVGELFPLKDDRPQRKNDRHLKLEEHNIADLIPTVLDIDTSFHRDADHFDITNVLQKLDSDGMLGEDEHQGNNTDAKIIETAAAAATAGEFPSTPPDVSTVATVPMTPVPAEDVQTDPAADKLPEKLLVVTTNNPEDDGHSTVIQKSTTAVSSDKAETTTTDQPPTPGSKDQSEDGGKVSIDRDNLGAVPTMTVKSEEQTTGSSTSDHGTEIATMKKDHEGQETTTATITEVAGKDVDAEIALKTTEGSSEKKVEATTLQSDEATTTMHPATATALHTTATMKATADQDTTTSTRLPTTTGKEQDVVPVGRSNFNHIDLDEEEKEELKAIFDETTTDEPTTTVGKPIGKPEVRVIQPETTTEKRHHGEEEPGTTEKRLSGEDETGTTEKHQPEQKPTSPAETTLSPKISKTGVEVTSPDVLSCSDIPGNYHFAFSQSPSAFVEAQNADEVRIMLKFTAGCEPTEEEEDQGAPRRPWSIEQFSASWIFTDVQGKSCLVVDSDQIDPKDDSSDQEMSVRIAEDVQTDSLMTPRCKLNATRFDVETAYDDSVCGIDSNLEVTDSGGRLGGSFKIRLTYRCQKPGTNASVADEDSIILLSALDSPASIAVRVYEKPNYAVQIAVMSAILLPLVAFVTWITFKRIRDSVRRKGMLPVSTNGDSGRHDNVITKSCNNNGSLEMVEHTNHVKARSSEGSKSNASTVVIENGGAEADDSKFPLMKDREAAANFSNPASENGPAGSLSAGEGWKYADEDGDDDKALTNNLNRDVEKGCH